MILKEIQNNLLKNITCWSVFKLIYKYIIIYKERERERKKGRESRDTYNVNVEVANVNNSITKYCTSRKSRHSLRALVGQSSCSLHLIMLK